MRKNRNALLASLVIAFVLATSFCVILYSSDNPTLALVNAENSTVHFPDSINGTFGIYFTDNFTKDTTLNKSLWVPNGNALSNVETNFPVSPVN